jgi:hypothetical protein
MAANPIYAINTPLINYFIYKNGPKIGEPLVAGKLHFYRNDDHATRADTYSDVSDPQNPVVNTNPIVLSAVGSCPPIYLQDIPYFIIIESAEGEVDATLTNYRGAVFGQDTNNTSDTINNLLANGQFSYPIQFNREDQTEGQITEAVTEVALGWNFVQDFGVESNNVKFNNIASELIEGDPQFECVVTSIPTLAETVKYLTAIYGSATAFEGFEMTFSIQMINKNLSGTIPVTISIEKNFGDDGSATLIENIATFDVTSTRTKFNISFTNPSSSGAVVGPGNYAAIRVNFPLNQFLSVGLTNVLMELGSFENPIYVGQDFSTEVSQSLGAVTEVEDLGLKDNYGLMTYSDGLIFPLAKTGDIVLSAEGIDYPDKLEIETPGQILPVSGYSEKNIPYRRLYNVIGNTYGGSNEYDLIVTSNGNVVTFTSGRGARQISDYTNGNIGAGYVVANPVVGLKYDFDLVLDPSNNRKIIMTWIDEFAINQTPGTSSQNPNVVSSGAIGNYFRAVAPVGVSPSIPPDWGSQSILTTTLDPGSPSDRPSASIEFVSENISSYVTYNIQWRWITGVGGLPYISSANLLEFAIDLSNNSRGRYSAPQSAGNLPPINGPAIIRFMLNGNFGSFPGFTPQANLYTIDFNMLTSESLESNIKRFISQIANPFVWTITINSAPLASQYFLYSSGPSDTGTEYYGWYRVNGVGTDPAIGGRTGIMIDILSTDSVNAIAQKTADAVNSLNFNLPTPGINLPELPEDSKSSYYIYL